MSLRYMSDNCLAKLRAAIPQNAVRYSTGRSWLEEYATGTGSIKETGISITSLPRLLISRRPADDAENAIRLYAGLRGLSAVQAMDERLWGYLCHVTYWDYMVARWGSTEENKIKDRFFFRFRGIGPLVRNGIARLWWFGHLTYEAHRQDPFELTRVLLSMQDIQSGLLQREFGKNRGVRCAILEFIKSRASRIEHTGGSSRTVQRLMRDLNTAGGVYLLDALRPPQINDILEASLNGTAA